MVAPQYRNIVVSLKTSAKELSRPLYPWLSSKGGVQSFVCLPTALISITVIEGTLKECVLSANPLTNAVKDALSVSLFKERFKGLGCQCAQPWAGKQEQ